MKKLAVIFALILFSSHFSYAVNKFEISPQFGLMHENSKDKYIDGANLQMIYHFTNHFALTLSTGYYQWSSGRERPAPGYDFESAYKKVSLLLGGRYYFSNPSTSKFSTYLNSNIGYDFIQIESDWTYYDLDSFAIEKTSTDTDKDKGLNLGIGAGAQVQITSHLLLDMNLSYFHPLVLDSFTHFLISLNYRF